MRRHPVTRLDDSSRIPPPGWAFRITTLRTSATRAPWLTGTWHQGGTQSADPTCALWLVLAEERAGLLHAALFADHEQIPGAYRHLAHHHGLAPGTWTSVLAPALASHPFTTHIHHPAPRTGRARAARALLAYLITHH